MPQLINHILASTTTLIASSGYIGIILAMSIESACIPLPSEVIMPFAGYLAGQGLLNIHLVALSGAIGNLIGSLIIYYLGRKSGHFLMHRIENIKYINTKHLKDTTTFFHNYGVAGVFIARLIPGIRTFISLPAGILEVSQKKFIAYTFVGSYIWSYLLSSIGYKLGKNWDSIMHSMSVFHTVIITCLIFGFIVLIFYIFAGKHRRQKITTESLKED